MNKAQGVKSLGEYTVARFLGRRESSQPDSDRPPLINWWARLDLNQGPIPYEGTALTAELRAPETSEQSERVSLFYSFPFIIAKSVRAHNLFHFFFA